MQAVRRRLHYSVYRACLIKSKSVQPSRQLGEAANTRPGGVRPHDYRLPSTSLCRPKIMGGTWLETIPVSTARACIRTMTGRKTAARKQERAGKRTGPAYHPVKPAIIGAWAAPNCSEHTLTMPARLRGPPSSINDEFIPPRSRQACPHSPLCSHLPSRVSP
ncbi:hypothetical protein GQ53DRAFT_753821 [Thozetella sp. PMI_491]|nr:hypothetical protein GQ53DRAFT_753821 [Thozetella sp. PMI_491]